MSALPLSCTPYSTAYSLSSLFAPKKAEKVLGNSISMQNEWITDYLFVTLVACTENNGKSKSYWTYEKYYYSRRVAGTYDTLTEGTGVDLNCTNFKNDQR